MVYYKRNDSNVWRGPGVVIGRDGKQVLVKHGGVYIRVNVCRLMSSQLPCIIAVAENSLRRYGEQNTNQVLAEDSEGEDLKTATAMIPVAAAGLHDEVSSSKT